MPKTEAQKQAQRTRTARNKANQAERRKRRIAYRKANPKPTIKTEAAIARKMRRKARKNEEQPHFEYESSQDGKLLSVTLVVPNNNQ